MRPYQTFHDLEILRASLQVPITRKGAILSDSDADTVRDVYLQWLLLLTDLRYLTPDTQVRQGHRLLADWAKRDVLDLNNACAECLQLIRLKSNKGFKALCSRISSHLYALVRDDVDLMIASNAFAARRLSQLFSYTSRLSLRDIDLTQQLLQDYCEIEDNIPSQYPDALVHRLNLVMKRWIGSFVPSEIVPKHGPGSVAGPATRAVQSKYENLQTDALLRYCFGADWWVTTDSPSKLERVSETIFVPKSYKTFRTISMEPPVLQYFQQGIWRSIDKQVASSSYLRNRIGFHEQTRNQELAKEGSALRNFATLDLSAASDSVSYDLVKKVFRGTWLYRYLIATRSTHTRLPNGQMLALKKFAPMGSALCFPIETLIFASICEIVTRGCGLPGRFSVFGDDIIVPSQCAEEVSTVLSRLGFKVNCTKSYSAIDCWFRESCGGEYFDGFDASPLRVSRKYRSNSDNVRLGELIDLANECYIRGYRNLRQFFLQKLLNQRTKEKSEVIPLFSPHGLLSDNYTNYRAKHRWNPKLQREEALVHQERALYSRKSLESQDESIRYRYWLETNYLRENLGEGFQSVICRPTAVVKFVWMPCEPTPLTTESIARLHPGKRSVTS